MADEHDETTGAEFEDVTPVIEEDGVDDDSDDERPDGEETSDTTGVD